MKNKIIQSLFLLAVGVLIFLANHFGLTAPEKIEFTDAEEALNIYVLDVGQGDSILAIGPNGETILIDAGPDNKVIEELGQVLPVSNKKIDYLILTHPHADHVAGMPELLNRYEIGTVYLTGVLHTSADYLYFLQLLEEGDYDTEFVDSYKKIELAPEFTLEFLAPLENFAEQKVENLNNSSIINKISYKGESILLSGDAEYEEESAVLDFYLNNLEVLRADLYKVGHHGSKTASSYEFLNAIQPQMALISCGLDNQFYHPHPSLLSKLEQKNIEYLRTDLQGAIHCWSDGAPWQCETEK